MVGEGEGVGAGEAGLHDSGLQMLLQNQTECVTEALSWRLTMVTLPVSQGRLIWKLHAGMVVAEGVGAVARG